MDVKSLAKSKRAHTQHHNKKHHSKPTTSKAPTPGPIASSENKPLGKGVREKPHQSQSSKGFNLPSNWDRYEEDYGLDLDDQSISGINPELDIFAPKSKGADYMYLLSEAKLQSEANIVSEIFPSFNDVFSDLNEGFGSLLSARGESILSWTGDDNFIVEDKATDTHEASFLSLNLHLLAEQLEKIDLPIRLFIEPDLFLAELSSEELRTADDESDQVQVASQSQATNKIFHELNNNPLNKDTFKDGETEVDLPLDAFSATDISDTSETKKYNDTLSRHEEEAVLHSHKDSDLFKSDATAINDLDDLLKETSASLTWEISSVQSTRSEPSFKGSDFSEIASKTSNFDDELDDLLLETCSSIKNFGGNLTGHSGPAQFLKTYQDLSKPASVMPNFDDELDGLLNETLNKKGISSSSSSLIPISKSKLSDDFDSFFDAS